jgi:PPM family protein phosphatase
MIKLLSASDTHVGLVRSNNEDAYLDIPDRGLFALSDGMGGAAAGEVASRYYIETVERIFANKTEKSVEEDAVLAEKVFTHANKQILEHSEKNPEDRGMGCTGDLLVFSGNQYTVGHVGDSRVYLFRHGKLQQLTRDHSLVQEWVDQGMITAEDARHHPRKNIILQVIGSQAALSPDILRGEAHDHDIFLLCSDGLTDMVEDDAIQEMLASLESPQAKVDNLINAALAAGGKDNVTAVLCELEIDATHSFSELEFDLANDRQNGK